MQLSTCDFVPATGTPADRACSPRSVNVDTVQGWAQLYEPDVNLVVYERDPGASLRQACEELANSDFSERRVLVELGKTGCALLTDLFLGQDAIALDLLQLCEAFGDLVGARALGLRIIRQLAPTCPAFHVDRILARAVTAYAGSGSQWLEERHVDRSALRRNQGESHRTPMHGGAPIQTIPSMHVALMKGEAWPGNSGRGLIHRSPPASDRPRVLVTIDPLD